jgi:hypothetical protein
MNEIQTLAAVTNWNWVDSPDHRGRVPDMPQVERTTLNILSGLARKTTHEKALYRALMRKLAYRAARDIDTQP